MTPVIFASALALFRATLSSDDPLFDKAAAGPHPVNGIWAALPVDCQTPTSLDLSTWPHCATPVGFLDGEIAALQKPAPDAKTPPDQFVALARTHFVVVGGSPVIAQVDVPIMFSRSTIYIALQPDAVDDKGGFVAATGWPVGCPAYPVDGIVKTGSRCVGSTPAAVRLAAQETPDPAKTYRLVRIDASAASAPPPTPPASPAAAAAVDGPPSTPPTAAPGAVGETSLPPVAPAPLPASPGSGPSPQAPGGPSP
jgi:hypothetical protein